MKTVNVPSLPDHMSYFTPPVWNTTPVLPDPEKPVTLSRIYNFIRYDALKSITAEVRANLDLKKSKLPFITPSICCFHRNENEIESYSNIISLDFDNYNINLRKKIFEDPFVHPALIFVSPSYHGFKVFIRIKNAVSENHLRYFLSLCAYYKSTYNILPDEACKDITRACFLCHDPSALVNHFGFVFADDLLKFEPSLPVESPEIDPSKPSFINPGIPDVPSFINPGAPDAPSFKASLSSRLNNDDRVHAHAVMSLKEKGWRCSGTKWFKPHKQKQNVQTALFRYYQLYKIYLFHVWSDNAPPFLHNKSYTDCQLIALLEYNGNYDHCIHDLILKYRVLKVENS